MGLLGMRSRVRIKKRFCHNHLALTTYFGMPTRVLGQLAGPEPAVEKESRTTSSNSLARQIGNRVDSILKWNAPSSFGKLPI